MSAWDKEARMTTAVPKILSILVSFVHDMPTQEWGHAGIQSTSVHILVPEF